jgi:ATP-binding cassette subfamily G (WHITE) protein 2 (PDR)
MFLYLQASEYISESASKGEIKLYPRTRIPEKHQKDEVNAPDDDIEASAGSSNRTARDDDEGIATEGNMKKQTAIFHWESLRYNVPVKGGTRRLLDHIDGWVKV